MGRGPCCEKVGMKKGPWTPEEDVILLSYIQQHGPGNWRAVPANTGLLRCSKSCRLRWTNYLRPGIKRGNFTPHEEEMIIHLQALLGNKWAAIASYLPQRTDNDIKNYWNTHLKNKLNRLHQAASMVVSNYKQHGIAEQKGKHNFSDVSLQQNSNVYASSAENISRLLEGWRKRSAGAGAGAGAGTAFNNRHDLDKSDGNIVVIATTNSEVADANVEGCCNTMDDIISYYENHVNSLGWEYTCTANIGEDDHKMHDENANYPLLDNCLFYENENIGHPTTSSSGGN